MSLISYKDTRPWAKAIKAAVITRRMPPWFADSKYGHFINDRSLKQSEIDTLAKWADTGAAEGDPKNAPTPVAWPTGGWSIQPEVVMDLPAHEVPAKGVLEWELIAFPAPFKGDAWVTSMRRDSSWTRADASIVSETELPTGKRVLEINPVANWTRRDVWAYLKKHNLPHHPLYDLGYASIGCAPCSRAIRFGEDERAGRWAGSEKVECGIHVAAALRQSEGTVATGGERADSQ